MFHPAVELSVVFSVLAVPSCFALPAIDAGPGERVPGEPPSHGRDSANVSGHAIPAVLCGNQYAVLYDTEPTEIDVLE